MKSADREPGSVSGGALSAPWNPFSRQAAKRLILQEAPDILHIHNSFPLLSPSVFSAASNTATATVLTLHNFRTFCAAGIPLRDERPCTACLDSRSVWPALRHRCYRGSLLATLPLAAMIWLHRQLKTWERQVDAFIALTEFQRDVLSAAGLPRERVFIKPHFYPNPPAPLSWSQREDKVVFVGRLGVEKGCRNLLAAWQLWGEKAPCLELIGDGPERTLLESVVAQTGMGQKIIFCGQLPFQETQRRLSRARLLVLPSLCFEGFPMVIREAFALGVPVAASRLGSMPYLVKEGLTGTLFAAGNPEDLLMQVKKAWERPQELHIWGEEARREFERKFTSQENYQALVNIYNNALLFKKSKYHLR